MRVFGSSLTLRGGVPLSLAFPLSFLFGFADVTAGVVPTSRSSEEFEREMEGSSSAPPVAESESTETSGIIELEPASRWLERSTVGGWAS